MLPDLNSLPPEDEDSGAEHEESADLQEDGHCLHGGEEAHASTDIPIADVQDATSAEEPDPHWINQARDLLVILAAAGQILILLHCKCSQKTWALCKASSRCLENSKAVQKRRKRGGRFSQENKELWTQENCSSTGASTVHS